MILINLPKAFHMAIIIPLKKVKARGSSNNAMRWFEIYLPKSFMVLLTVGSLILQMILIAQLSFLQNPYGVNAQRRIQRLFFTKVINIYQRLTKSLHQGCLTVLNTPLHLSAFVFLCIDACLLLQLTDVKKNQNKISL